MVDQLKQENTKRKADRIQLTPTQEALFFLTEAMSTLQWSRASDIVGRKPILLIGLFGTTLSILFFGLSKTFTALVIRYIPRPSFWVNFANNARFDIFCSRCLCGLLNGNVGVMKSTMGDLTDKTNRAEALVFLPSAFAFPSQCTAPLLRPE